MTDNIITTKNLSFSYNKDRILNDINIAVPKGSIYGYLGKNGAGKTTTINLILKLLALKKDTIFYDGADISTLDEKYFNNIGTLIQPASLYLHMTCWEQMKYLDYFFNVGKATIEKVLKEVDMFDQRNKKIKAMSAGMKQRLAIAMALLHNPEMLILDEPINGLDPNGIHEFRELIISLNKEGKTVFVSSHILGEMQKMCSHIGIIDNGNLLFQGGLDEIINSMAAQIQIRTSNIELSKEILENLDIQNITISNEKLTCDIDNEKQYATVINSICKKNIDIYDISRKEINLESFYLNLIK